MSENKPKSDNKTVIIAAVVVALIVIGGGLYYNKQKNTKTISMSVGGKEISATFEK